MDLLKLLQDLNAALDGLKQQAADAEAALAAAKQASYDEGFAAGVASVDSTKIYTQTDLDNAVAAAVGPLQDQINALSEQVSALQGQLDTKVAEAVAQAKAEFVADLQALKATEDTDVDAVIAKHTPPVVVPEPTPEPTPDPTPAAE